MSREAHTVISFDPDFAGRFVLFDAAHITTMLLIGSTWVVVPLWLRRRADDTLNTRVCQILAGLLAVAMLGWPLWELATGRFTWQLSLPLNLCDLSSYLCIIVLLTRSHKLFEIVYFWSLAGAIQSYVTPNVFYGFPHVEFYDFYLQHGGEILAIIVLATACGLRPYPRSILLALGAMVAYVGFVYLVNLALDANYLFLMADTPQPSLVTKLIAVLGEPPRHIIGLAGVSVVSVAILYTPYLALDKLRAARGTGPDASGKSA